MRGLLILLALTGCASYSGHWAKSDMSGLTKDHYECEKDARQTFGKPTFENFDTMLGFARQCMNARGYTWVQT